MPESNMALLVPKDIRAPPIMEGTQHPMIQSQRWEVRRMPNPTRRVERIETMPEGVFRRAEWGLEKPKEEMRVAE